jgi:hypothetical protein
VGLGYRSIRAAASALLVATAVGAGGMTGMTSVLAVDPAVVTVTGTVADEGGAPLAAFPLVISEELPPDGGLVGVQTTTAADGSFSAEIQRWGTAEAPATLRITTGAPYEIDVPGDPCSQTWGFAVTDEREVALADGQPDPLTLTAARTLVGEVCGTTGTPTDSGTGGGSSKVTPPPTDTSAAQLAAPSERRGPALTMGFVLGLLIAAVLLVPRPGARRRD